MSPGACFQPSSRPGHHQCRRRLETGGVLEKNTGINIILGEVDEYTASKNSAIESTDLRLFSEYDIIATLDGNVRTIYALL